METVTRHIGFCAICERDIKLAKGKLVHHGYERPGYGYILGDCLAVHADPYEVSCEIVKTHRDRLAGHKAATEKQLADFKGGKVAYFIEIEKSRRSTWADEITTIHEFALGVTAWYRFERAVERRVQRLTYEVEGLTAEIARCDRWIDKWEPKPIRTIEEKEAEERVARDARKAERDAARKARDDKKAATKAKQEALAKKREDMKVEVKKEAERLAALKSAGKVDPKYHKDRSKLATKLRNMQSWLWSTELLEGTGEALTVIGLATIENGPGYNKPWLRLYV